LLACGLVLSLLALFIRRQRDRAASVAMQRRICSFVLFDGFLDDGYEGLFPLLGFAAMIALLLILSVGLMDRSG
jgi:hypothetical protein